MIKIDGFLDYEESRVERGRVEVVSFIHWECLIFTAEFLSSSFWVSPVSLLCSHTETQIHADHMGSSARPSDKPQQTKTMTKHSSCGQTKDEQKKGRREAKRDGDVGDEDM